MHVKLIDDLTDDEWANLTPMETHLIVALQNVNNAARIWPVTHGPDVTLERIVEMTATVFEGPRKPAGT